MFEQTTIQSVLVTAGQIALGWTALSVLAASAWSLHRAPGRATRLALDDRTLMPAYATADVSQPLHIRSAA